MSEAGGSLRKKPKGHWHKSNEEENFSGRNTMFIFTSMHTLEKPKSVNGFPWRKTTKAFQSVPEDNW